MGQCAREGKSVKDLQSMPHSGRAGLKMRIIAIVNQKGGCGKTTTAINVSAILARRGYRALLVDMDPQSHCAVGLGVPENRIDLDIGDAMLTSHERALDKKRLIWRIGKNLDLLPSRMRLAGLESSRGGLADKPDKERRLLGVLSRFSGQYDVAVVDCSPAIGLLTFNALAAAQVVIIPVETGYFSLQGATRQVNTVRTVAKRLGSALPVWVLPTIHEETNPVACDLLAELRRRFAQRTIPVVIRRDDKLREAATFGKAIVDYSPSSRGAEDYSLLASWSIHHGLVAGAAPVATEDDLPDTLDAPYEEGAAEAPAAAVEAKPLSPEFPVSHARAEHVPEPVGAAPAGSRAEDLVRRAQQMIRRSMETRAREVAEQSQAQEPTTVLRLEAPAPSAPTPAVSAQAKMLLGARPTRQGVLFVQPLSAGKSLAIAGNFNGWTETPMRRNEELGVYEALLPLTPGRYQYRVVCDGRWTTDPYNESFEMNAFGEPSSIVEVRTSRTA